MASESQFWHMKQLLVMLAHFKWNGLWHLLYSMELFLVNLAGKFCMEIKQISTSSSDDDCDFFIEAGGSFGLYSFCGCLFLWWLLSLFYTFFLLVLHIIIFRPFSLKIRTFFGDVSTALFIGLRLRADFFCGVPGVPLNISRNFLNIPRVYLQNT